MIELTEQLAQLFEKLPQTPVHFVNPRTQEAFVLLRAEEYEQLAQADYDDGPWTDEETAHLAAEAGEMLDSFRKKP